MKKFHSEDAWLINPDRSRRSRKKRKVVIMARRKRSRKVSRKRARSYGQRRKAVMTLLKSNPGRRKRRASRSVVRRRSRRRYRRNPSFGLGGILPSKSSLFDAVYVTGGFIGTKIAASTVLPMIGVNQPIVRIGVKAVLAGALGWAGRRFLGGNAGQYLMIGGLVETVNDAVQTYLTPYVPALAVSSYPGLESYVDMSAYPDMSSYVGGMVSPDLDEQV